MQERFNVIKSKVHRVSLFMENFNFSNFYSFSNLTLERYLVPNYIKSIFIKNFYSVSHIKWEKLKNLRENNFLFGRYKIQNE